MTNDLSADDTQKTKAVKPDAPKVDSTPEPEKISPARIFTNILWFLFFVGLLWLSDLAGEAIPTPLDDMVYDAAIATLFGILSSIGVFTKRK